MIFSSIRWRLQIWYGLILIVVLSGFGVTAYHMAREAQLRRVDQDLGQWLGTVLRPEPPGKRGDPPGREMKPGGMFEAGSFGPKDGWEGEGLSFGDRPRPRHGFTGGMHLQIMAAIEQIANGQTNGPYIAYWLEQEPVISSANAPVDATRMRPAGEMRPGPPDALKFRSRGEFRECYKPLPGGGCLLVGRSLAPDLAAMQRLALWLVAAGTGILLVGLAGGWWVASRAMQPIEEISVTAQKISAVDLSQRISVADTDDELAWLAEILNSTFGRLEAAFEQQARFTADASHELRTPLAVLLSQTQSALSRPRSAGEYACALEACQRAAQRMRKLTEALLTLARLDTSRELARREGFDLARVVRDSLEMLRPLAEERSVRLDECLPATRMSGDPEQISQVVANLVTNAIQHTNPGGVVKLATKLEEGNALLRVEDSGEGISGEHLEHIFERFYRADKSRSAPAGRTGLGLAICKAIVEMHKGTITATSQPGVGSTFTVSLPAS